MWEADGVFDVLDGFLISLALTVAALERGAGDEITVGVGFDDDGKRQISDICIIGSPRFHTNRFA